MSIETVFLDAGGVLCHPSWTRVADALVRQGAAVTAAALAAAEQKATYDIDKASVIGSTDDRARGWLYFNLVLHHAGVPQGDATDAALAELREYHRTDNLWEHVEPDVEPALAALKSRGLKHVVVSNANGRLRHWFDRVDLDACGTCSIVSTSPSGSITCSTRTNGASRSLTRGCSGTRWNAQAPSRRVPSTSVTSITLT
jgi:FMN phosphatase YigB (HAD superfamily)